MESSGVIVITLGVCMCVYTCVCLHVHVCMSVFTIDMYEIVKR